MNPRHLRTQAWFFIILSAGLFIAGFAQEIVCVSMARE